MNKSAGILYIITLLAAIVCGSYAQIVSDENDKLKGEVSILKLIFSPEILKFIMVDEKAIS